MHEQPAREFDGFRIVGRSERRAMASRSTRPSSNSIASGASIEPRQTAGFVTEQQSRPALPLVVGM